MEIVTCLSKEFVYNKIVNNKNSIMMPVNGCDQMLISGLESDNNVKVNYL
jgi:hypothetical protein